MAVSKYEQWLFDKCYQIPTNDSTSGNQSSDKETFIYNKHSQGDESEHWMLMLDPKTPLTHYLLFTTSGTSSDTSISVFAKLYVFPQRKQIFLVDAQVQYKDASKEFDDGRLRTLKKEWFKTHQKNIFSTMTDAFFGANWHVCCGMYVRYLKSIVKYYKRRGLIKQLLCQLPWFTTLRSKELYQMSTYDERDQMFELFNKYVKEQEIKWLKLVKFI